MLVSEKRSPPFADLLRLQDTMRWSPVSAASTALRVVTPSFLTRHQKPRRLHPTSYLDGLRGVAALFVVFNHYVSQYFDQLPHGWRNDNDLEGKHRWLIQLPVLRVVYSGTFMVTIFFIISGYVLSHKALGLSRQRQWTPLLKSLASSVFRRWIRLMVPALTSMFVAFLLVRFRLTCQLPKTWSDFTIVDPAEIQPQQDIVGAHLPERMDSIIDQFLDLSWDAYQMADPFRFGTIQWPRYCIALWTMQVEYMGSMVVFVTVLGISMVRHHLRMIFLVTLVAYTLLTGRWVYTLFMAGVAFSEWSYNVTSPAPLLGSSDDTPKSDPEEDRTFTQNVLLHSPDLAAFIFAIYLGTYPEFDPEVTPGYRLLHRLIPPNFPDEGRFWPIFGALLMVFLLQNAKFLQGIFTTRIAQYLGDISLSMYMLHTHVELTLGNWLIPRLLRRTSGFGPLNFTVGMTLSLTCLAIFTLFISDLFWRYVDTKAVRLARWVSIQCFVDDDDTTDRSRFRELQERRVTDGSAV